jgi:glucose/arabinose dehydrogenase
VRSLAAVAATFSFAGAASAEPISDPFPEKIAKSDVRVELKPVARGLVSPVLLLPVPYNPKRLLVVDQVGLVRVIEDGALREEPWLDVLSRLVKLTPEFDERGLLSVAFDPDYAKPGTPGTGRIFTYTSEPAAGRADFPIVHGDVAPNHQSVIASWRVTDHGDRVNPDSRKELLRIDEPQFNHNGGMIAFGPDGFLYIGMGDGGSGNDLGPGHNPETGNGQDRNVVLGKMLRIDANGTNAKNGAYGIPKDNPFANGGGVAEIFAIGLRNPWRFSFDGATLLAADVGQNKVEMVHRVERGANHGWRAKEGTFKFNKNGIIEAADESLREGFATPVLQYDHDEGTSITGGYVYHGKALPALAGKYVFADYRSPSKPTTARLFFGDLANGRIEEARIGADDREVGFLIKGFGVDLDGEHYVVGSVAQGPSGNGGVVMKIVAP